MNDIQSSEDIHQLVTLFYSKVTGDELIASFFVTLNWDEHLPKMEKFWRFVLLDEAGYTTNVTDKHINMRLEPKHFKRWLTLFKESVDALFQGETAERAKQRAELIGWTIQSKIN